MIRSVKLDNWRAYRSFRLDFQPGTTFLVAPNGVGKSSFLEAIHWALDAEAKPLAAPMRLRAERSHVDIGLLAGEASVRIKRTLLRGRGRTPTLESEAWINDRVATIDEAMALLADAWAADNRFASRAAFLTDRFADSTRDPDLRAHLTAVHGLDHLQDAANRIAAEWKAATERADNARRTATTQQSEIRDAEAAAREAEARAADAERQVAECRTASDDANSALARAQSVNALHEAVGRWRADREELAEVIHGLLGTAPADLDLRPTIRAAEAAARAQLAELEAQQARLRERLATVEEALERLRAAGGECPVCRRPLDDDTRGRAEQEHQHDLARAAGRLDTLDSTPARTLVQQLADTAARVERLGDPPQPPEEAFIDLAPLKPLAAAAQDNLERALADAGQARAEAAAARTHVEELRADSERESATHMYTKVAALEAAKAALDKTISDVLDAQLGPVAGEVNRRWEAIFPDRPGLRLDPQGRMTRPFDDGENIDIDWFSTGERVVAKLLLRLATLASTTNVPFCVVDEPLEHLDPDARGYVARTLAFLGMGDALRQILVTTYEQQLAVQLAGFDRSRVHLEFLRTAHVTN